MKNYNTTNIRDSTHLLADSGISLYQNGMMGYNIVPTDAIKDLSIIIPRKEHAINQ